VSARRGAGIAPGRTIGTHPLTIVARSAKSGWRQPAVSREPHWQENATLAGGRTTSRAVGVSPPWFGERTCKNASAKSRVTAAGGRRTSVQLHL